MDVTQRLQEAAIELLTSDDHLGDRSQVIGASEVGRCVRLVIHQKLSGESSIDAAGAGRMLAGKALENTVVQICRKVFDGVKATGRKQVELKHSTLPLVCHPDGLMPTAALEIKTAGTHAYRKYVKDGLPIYYVDQATVEAGLSSKQETLLVLANRDTLEAQPFNIPFDPERYKGIEDRASTMAHHLQFKTLPDGEPERGVCSSCPIKSNCTAYSLQIAEAKTEELALDVQLEAETILEELKALQDPRSDEDLEREKELKGKLKKILAEAGYHSGSLGVAKVSLSESKGRETVDGKGLKAAHPEIYASFLKTGAPSVRMEIEFL